MLFLCAFSLYSQNYKITYGLTIKEDKSRMEDKIEYIRKAHIRAINGAKNLSFSLLCNDSTSYFEKKDILDIDSKETQSAIRASSTKDPYFMNANYVFTIKKETPIGSNYIVKDTLIKNWTITNESKKIANYTCYKATTNYKIENSVGIFYHPVIAWFCPEIPLQYGPRGFGGLPGLILELQYRETVFGAEKIEKTDEKIEVNLKGKIITKKEYNNKIHELAKNRF